MNAPVLLPGLEEHVADILLNWDYRHLELEFRIGLKAPTFVPSVGRDRFEALRRSLGHAQCEKSVHEVFAVQGGTLRRERTPTDVKWTHKSRLANFDARLVEGSPWHVRASLSFERAEQHADPGHPPSFVRRRERWSYLRGAWSIDLTAVTSTSPTDLDNDEANYEVEVELADRDEFFRTPVHEIVAQGLRLATGLVLSLGQ